MRTIFAASLRSSSFFFFFFFLQSVNGRENGENKNTIRCHCARWFMMHRAPATRERDYINKYEHIGLHEGMYDAREKRNHTFNMDQGKSHCIIINVVLFISYVKFTQILIAHCTMKFNLGIFNTFEDQGSQKCITHSFFRFIFRDLILTLETRKRNFIWTRLKFNQSTEKTKCTSLLRIHWCIT